MKVFWASIAEQDRTDIIDHISNDSPLAAIRMDELFAEAAARLSDDPHLGKTGQIPGTRELIPHENYRLVYEVQGEVVWILALVHTARRWPGLEGQPDRSLPPGNGLHIMGRQPGQFHELVRAHFLHALALGDLGTPACAKAGRSHRARIALIAARATMPFIVSCFTD